ncbi:MAG: hypothetical protein K2G45_10370 [Lachnospiraceae bacterium]|nr:hypothetical protein [Lachnospiraceae bacterium]
MKMVKKIYVSVIILSAMLLCTACGKAKRDDIADELKGNLGVDISDDDSVTQNEADEIPDNISYAVNVEGRIINVDAKVYADGYGNVPTFAVTEYADKEEWILDYAKKIFDYGEYKNVKPYYLLDKLSKEELEEELEIHKKYYPENNGMNQDNWAGYIEELLDNYNGENYVSMPNQLIYENRTVTENIFSIYSTYEANLRGYVDGRMWTLNYMEGYHEFIGIEGEMVHDEYSPRLVGKCIEEEYDISNTNVPLSTDETHLKKPYKQENAENQAKDFMKKFGFDNMELLYIGENELYTANGTYKDGYTLVFGMSENGAHLLYGYEVGETAVEPEAEYTAIQPYVEVIVNSNGVYGITIRGNYNEPEIMAEESKLLSFEQINEIAKEEFSEMLEKDDSVSFDIGSIEFGYVYITYDGFSYAVVPVWRYYDSAGGRDSEIRIVYLTICALDGSVIYCSGAPTMNQLTPIAY